MPEPDLQKRYEELAVVAEVSSAMLSPASLDEVLKVAIGTVSRALGARFGSIMLLNADRTLLDYAATYNLTAEYIERVRRTAPVHADPSTPPGRALATRQPYAIADVSTDPLFAPWKEVALQEGYQSAICMPLIAAGEPVGTLHLCLPEPHSFWPSEIRLLSIVCQEVGLAIERARLYDNARAANDRKSRFLAAMSHELRTPLTAILGFTNILLEQLNGPLTAQQQWQLRVVSASAQHVMLLINDALDLAKIEAGKMDWQRETVDAASVAAEAIEMLTPLAEAKGLTLEWRDEAPPLSLYTERRRCKQILVNLVSNAIKFTSRGGVTLSAARDPAEPRFAGVRVTDTGVGIRPEDAARLFHDFEQLETLPAGSTGSSSGLGLSLSRKLARLMGGDVTVESTYGQGSTFTLRLEAAP